MEAVRRAGDRPVLARVVAAPGSAWTGAVAERLRLGGALLRTAPLGGPGWRRSTCCAPAWPTSLAYARGERDMIVLRHEFGSSIATAAIDREDLDARRVRRARRRFGDGPHGRPFPAAVAARLILDGRIAATGVRIPVDPEIYEPVLDALEPMGIVFRETRTAP